jgi:hypothetical protein
MRTPAEHATIQVELTSACVLRCSNCTRFCGTHKVPFFMEESLFRAAIDSLVEYAKQPHAIVGFMGGEPLLHPKFAEFCDYALGKIPREKLGLWSTFPDAPKYKGYRDVIVKTFGNVLLNDHSRSDILHAPVLMASEEYFQKPCPTCGRNTPAWLSSEYRDKDCPECGNKGTVTDMRELLYATEHCWVQESWSSAINPKGAFFCEVAAALSDLFDGPEGWKVEPGWWKRTPAEFLAQREWACTKCGAAMPIARVRNSQDTRDDVSKGNLERLVQIGSKKVARGEYEVRQFEFDPKLNVNHGYPRQTYQDEQYRKGIAARYGIDLIMTPRGYWEPVLHDPNRKEPERIPSLFGLYQERYTEATAQRPTGD